MSGTDEVSGTRGDVGPDELEAALREMCSLLAENNDARFIYDFFGCLFTKAELVDFAKRWLLVREIDKGTTQREIARKFHISLCKITRGSRELKKDSSAFRRLLDCADALENQPRKD